MTLIIILIAVIALVVLYGCNANLIRRKNGVAEALAGIDVQLTQRHDLIPNLLAIAKRFMAHEQDLIEDITRLRTQAAAAVGATDPAGLEARFVAEDKLDAGLQHLFAVAENYPDLKSHTPMIEAQRSLTEVETNIAAARRFYNTSVGELRNAADTFPGPLLAGPAGVGALPPFYQASAEQKGPVDASALLQ